MDAPLTQVPPRFIHTFSRYASWIPTSKTFQGGNTIPASAVWPTANKALYLPIVLPFWFNVRRFYVANGGAVSGNFDIGIVTPDGTKLASAGSTAQSGTNTNQYVAGFNFLLAPGWYYLALAFDNTTATTMRTSVGSTITGPPSGLLEQTSAFVLPATVTFAQTNASYYPLFGFTSTESGF
jgi:hypothetical protein